MSWNVVLQLDTALTRFCEEFSMPGLRRPCRILIICDPGLERTAQQAFDDMRATLLAKAKSSRTCHGPIHPGSQTEKEPACVHALVPIVDQPSASIVAVIAGWMSKPADRWLVLPTVARGIDPAKVLAALSTKMSRLQLVPWGATSAVWPRSSCNVLSMVSARAFSSATGERKATRWPISSSIR